MDSVIAPQSFQHQGNPAAASDLLLIFGCFFFPTRFLLGVGRKQRWAASKDSGSHHPWMLLKAFLFPYVLLIPPRTTSQHRAVQ